MKKDLITVVVAFIVATIILFILHNLLYTTPHFTVRLPLIGGICIGLFVGMWRHNSLKT